MMRTILRFVLLSWALLMLVSCGGGGAGSDPVGPVIAPPNPPANVVAIGTDGKVVLSWDTSEGATLYHIKRSTTTGGPYQEVAAPSATHYTDTGLSNGSAYYYVVSASNAEATGGDSTEVVATPSTNLPVLPESDSTKNYMGMNTWFLNDWDKSFAFVDAMKHARPWRNAAWNGSVAMDDFGWPLADASTVIYTGTPAQINGTYKLIFKGQATVALMWSAGSVTNKTYDADTNTTTADVTYNLAATNSVGLIFSNTKRTASSSVNTGFTDVRLYRPGYPADGTVVFTSDFVNALKKTSAIRLMDWSATNSNLTQRWEDRRTPAHMFKLTPTYTGPGGAVWESLDVNGNPAYNAGVAIEHQIQLCNQVGSDCWINIPPAADDDYVQKLALALRYGTDGTNPYTSYQAHPVYPPLAADLRVYVEYANEIWNTAYGFQSYRVILDIANSLPSNHILRQFLHSNANVYQLVYAYPAYRLAGISDIFRSVYGDASMMSRVRPVLMTQQGNANDTLRLALNWIDAYAKSQGRVVNSYFYGAGGSAYYDSDATITDADRGNADLFFSGAYDTHHIRNMELDALWAASFGLKRIAYEGGPGLDYYTQQQADAINLDPRMKTMIVNTHNAWSALGGDLLMYYVAVGPREWNFSESISSPNTPKNQGLDQLNTQARAAVTVGQALPGEVAYLDPDVTSDSSAQIAGGGYWGYKTSCDALPCWAGMDAAGEWLAMKAHSDSAFNGNLAVNGLSPLGAVVRVYINGINQGNVTLTANAHLANSNSIPVAIPKGLVSIRLEWVGGSVSLRSAKITQ